MIMECDIMPFQMDLFETPHESLMRQRLEKVEAMALKSKESGDRVRKGTYASINELRKQVVDLSARLEFIERAICRGTDD